MWSPWAATQGGPYTDSPTAPFIRSIQQFQTVGVDVEAGLWVIAVIAAGTQAQPLGRQTHLTVDMTQRN